MNRAASNGDHSGQATRPKQAQPICTGHEPHGLRESHRSHRTKTIKLSTPWDQRTAYDPVGPGAHPSAHFSPIIRHRVLFPLDRASARQRRDGFPLMVRAVRLSIEAVDRRIETVAGTLGASPISVFFMVRLLLSLPGVLLGAILCFATALGEFGACTPHLALSHVGRSAQFPRVAPSSHPVAAAVPSQQH